MVFGALYQITWADELALDRYEGVGRGRYFREYIRVGRQWALAYVMDDCRPEQAPSAEYYAIVEQGYRDWKLPMSTLASARASSDGRRL
jgi:hypothetical protein